MSKLRSAQEKSRMAARMLADHLGVDNALDRPMGEVLLNINERNADALTALAEYAKALGEHAALLDLIDEESAYGHPAVKIPLLTAVEREKQALLKLKEYMK